jgi:hypothetical protein
MRLYLTGFYESRIRPESQKITQKVAGKKYEVCAFTLSALSILMVDFSLQTAQQPQATENLPMSDICQR